MRSSSSAPFQEILCPVDFSANARGALRYAAATASRFGGRLTVLFVNDPLLSAAAAASAYDTGRLARDTEAELRRFVTRSLGRGADVAYRTANGHPAREILKAAGAISADLVVVGSRGLTGAGKWFFGSTAERLLRTTDVPVLVVPRDRRQAGAKWAQALGRWPGRRVLVPIDLEDHHAADVRRAIASAKAFGAKAILFYAVPAPQVPEWMRIGPRRRDAGRVREAQQRLQAMAQTLGADGAQVAFGSAGEEIAAAAASTGSQLVVLTIVRATGLLGPHQGSITYKVVSSETAPVLALPSSGPRKPLAK